MNKYPEGTPLSIIQQMGEMRYKGHYYQEIADKFGVGETTVRRHLKKHGLSKKKKNRATNRILNKEALTLKMTELAKKKYTNLQISVELDVSLGTVYNYLREVKPEINNLPSNVVEINGSNYKKGVHNLIFRETADGGWNRSTLDAGLFESHR